MMQQLGVMLYKEREKMGVTQKNIAEGIISISELCRVERGEQEVDYFTLQALFERLGKSIDKLELAVSASEYESISCRMGIERGIEMWDYECLTGLIAKYNEYNDGRRPIHKQYMAVLRAMVCYMKERDYAACLNGMEQALAYTLYDDWSRKFVISQRLCNQEIRLILMIAYCRWKLGRTDGLTERLEQFGGYILHHYTDTEEQVKVYPHCVWLLGQLYLGQGRVDEAYAVCRKGKESLIENGSLSPMREILELEETCLEIMGKTVELTKCRMYRDAVSFLYKVAGAYLESDKMAVFMKSSFQGELVITNELVKDLREAKGLSQEELCADICSQETLSRIENGKRSPNKKNLYQLLKRMGMERENYYGFIEADDYELYEKARQYNRCFPKGMRKEAMELLDEIENRVDLKKNINRQFIGMERVTEQMTIGALSKEQAKQKLYELLQLTMPSVNSGKLIYRVPFRTEYMIYNKIALNLRNSGKTENALCIYEQLMQGYKKSKVSMCYHAVPGLTLYINYTGILEEHNELEKAEEIGNEGLKHCLKCCRGDMAGDILANLSIVYGKKELPDVEEVYLRYGYYLICLYDRNDMASILQKAYRGKFHKKLD